ncbi:MAG: lysylphosphatidylglycerol synthase domain-containing protein [Acidimicrobiales bacterium]
MTGPVPDVAARPRRRGIGLSTVVGLVIGLAACAFVVRTLGSEWDRVGDAIADASGPWLVVGLAAAALAMTSIAWNWTDVLALLGLRVSRGRVVSWYYVGELGKYLPGGVWPVVGRGEMARRGGIPRAQAYASVALSLATLYLGAAFVALVLLPISIAGGGDLGAEALLLVLLPLGLGALHPRLLRPALGVLRRVTKRDLPVEIPSWSASVILVLRYLPCWLFVGAATWAVARALGPDAPVARIMFAAVLSWIAGFAAVPVPAGAGIREAVFIAASGLPDALGATVAVATRVLFILVDGGGAAVAGPFLRRRRAVRARG